MRRVALRTERRSGIEVRNTCDALTGLGMGDFASQGVALGCYVPAFQADEQMGSQALSLPREVLWVIIFRTFRLMKQMT
jgi:hypothetical protein